MNKMTLYEISADVEAALSADEFNPEELEALVHRMEDKAAAVVAFTDQVQAFADYCKSEEKRIAERRKFAENRAARLKQYLQSCMEQAGMFEMEIGTKKASIQKNPPAVIIDNELELPGKFITIVQTETIDKRAIKEAIKTGEVVPGAHMQQSLSLRIK